jgi:cytochrome c peroxidase
MNHTDVNASLGLLAALLVCCCVGFCSLGNAEGPGDSMPRSKVNLGLPPVPVPSENPLTPAKIALGKRLFFDASLSADGTISCASCHRPGQAFSDGRPVAKGIGGQSGTRNSPTLLNAAFNLSQFWDGRRPSLEAQALDPLANPREHALRNEDDLVRRLRANESYAAQFLSAFPGDPGPAVTSAHIAQALASFERTLIAGDSPFDEYYFGHRPAALSASALRGFKLFRGAGRCSGCHTIERTFALFTDNRFHSTNIGLDRINSKLPTLTTRLVAARQAGVSIDQEVLSDSDVAALGRFVVTLNPRDIGKFRTPSLRNVALTAPYMHDGSVPTLRQAVELELYDRSQPGRPLILTPQDKQDLVEFLEALTSPSAAGVKPLQNGAQAALSPRSVQNSEPGG